MSKQPTIDLIESLFETSKDYAENRLELLKLKAIDKSSKVISTIISGVLFFVVFFIFFIVFNIGLGLLIGDFVGKPSWGFLLLSAFYLLVGLVLFISRNKLLKMPIANKLIQKFA